MYIKLIFGVALLFGVPATAMDVKMKEASQNEQKVKILLQDEQNPESTHEVEVPVRLAKLIRPDFIADLLGDAARVEDMRLPLPRVTIETWRLIEEQLERVYGIIHDVGTADLLKKEIFSAYDKLDSKSLSELICAADYLEMPILLEVACDVVMKGALEKLSFEDIVWLPQDMRYRIILHKLLMLVGPVPGREQTRAQQQGMVISVCLAEDGKIVSGSVDGTVRVWDMEGKELAACRSHDDFAVTSVCVTNDGKIVSGSWDTVCVWDMQGNELAVCKGHEGPVNSVCVTKDGKIVSGSDDRTVRVWDMKGNELAVCGGHEHQVNSVCVTKDGRIVSGSYDKTVRVWDMQGNQLAVCRGHEGGVTSVCVTKDGKIVSGSWGTARVWDMQGQELAVCRGHEGPVLSVYVTDGKIVSGSDDRTVRVWDIEGNELAVCRGHEYSVTCLCVTKDGKIVSGSSDKTVRVWDISLLDRIRCVDEVQEQAVWKLLHKIAQHGGEIANQKCWQEIESILMEESVSSSGSNVSNNNNTDDR